MQFSGTPDAVLVRSLILAVGWFNPPRLLPRTMALVCQRPVGQKAAPQLQGEVPMKRPR